MNKKRLLCIVLSFVAVCSLFLLDNSVAWFNTETGVQLSQELTIPKMDYEFIGELGSYFSDNDEEEFVMTGENLILFNEAQERVISLVNHSTMDTEVRFQITYPTPDNSAQVYAPTDADLELTLSDDKAWTYADGYYSTSFSAAEGGDAEYDVIDYIGYSDSIDREDYLDTDAEGRVGTPVSGDVVITFQAKQVGHVEWDEIEWTISTP